MIERLDMNNSYSSLEAAIHVNRYAFVKNICKGKKILDISCGEGYGSNLLETWGAKSVLGVDISEETIKKATKMYASDITSFMQSNAQKLEKIEDNTFDMIVSFETIEHIEKPELFLKEIKRVAKKDAIYVISCPNDYFYYPTDEEHNPFHQRKYHFEDYKKLVEKVLGKGNYFFGYSIDGYCNLKLENETKVTKQSQMKNIKENESHVLSTDNKLDNKNCCYYIGVFGNVDIDNTYTIFPISMENTVYHISKAKDKYIHELEKYQKELVDYKDELENCQKELKKDIESKIKEIEDLKNENSKLSKELNEIKNSKGYKLIRIIKKSE